MEYTWLGIVTVAILVFSCLIGYRRGFVKEVVSTCFFLLAIVIVWVINPYVDSFLEERTPVYEKIQESCRESVEKQLAGLEENSREAQERFIEDLPLPGFLKTQIESNNKQEVYTYLAVETFTDYVAESLAKMLLNGIGFVISYLLAVVMIYAVAYILNIIAKLPILRGVNKMAGFLMGGIRGLLWIWIALLILTIFCNTSWGETCMVMIEQDRFLSFLYNNNIFVKIFMSIFYGK